IVGERGSVTSIEIDSDLCARAKRLLAHDGSTTAGTPRAPIKLIHGDARTAAPEVLARFAHAAPGVNKIAVTYAVDAVPEPIEAAGCERGVLVAPVGAKDDEQELVRCERRNGVLFVTTHGAVRYVAERRARR